MTAMTLTGHAAQRAAQRGIPPFIMELLDNFGSEVNQNGSSLLLFDKAARKRLRQYFGRRLFNTLEPFWDAYLVRAHDGGVITVGHRTRTIHR